MPATPIANDDGIVEDTYQFGVADQATQGNVPYDPVGADYIVKFGDSSPFVSIEELPTGRPGTPFQTDLHRTYTRRFRVIVKSKWFGAGFVCRCPGLPVPYAPYIPYRREEYDPQAKAVNITADTEPGTDDWVTWFVTVTYSTEMPLWGPLFGKQKLGWDDVNGVQNKPWRIPPYKEWETETFTDYPFKDLDNKPMLNAAGQPFTPPFGVTGGYKVCTVTRFEKDFETRNEDYIYVTNSMDLLGSPPGYALCTGPRATEMYIGSIKFHKVTYRLLLKKRIDLGNGNYIDGWDPIRVLNAGMYQKDTFFGVAVPRLVPIVRFGHVVSHPVLLDAAGREQTAKDADGNLIPTYISRKFYRRVDLNALLNPQD